MNLKDKIAKIVKANGAMLYDIESVVENENIIFRVYITKKGGVDLDLCANISYDLSPFLDINPPVDGKYFLEVSSPGIERKLKNPNHFQSAIGEKIKFRSDKGKYKGTLKSADDKGFIVDIKGENLSFDYEDISKAKTYFDWNKL